jgi:Ni/Co efflux regulator RcnB
MKKHLGRWVVCGALLLSFSVASSAQPLGQDHQRQDQGDHGKNKDKHNDKRGDHGGRDQGGHDQGNRDRGYGDHRDNRNGYGNDRAYAYGHDRNDGDHGGYRGMHDRGRHEGWYRRGGYVPVEYRGASYVVDDWHGEHLRRPRRGYHWVRSDNGDFLLVAITTGVIVDLLLHH